MSLKLEFNEKPRHFARPVKWKGRTINPKWYREYKKMIGNQAMIQLPLGYKVITGPIAINFHFEFIKAKSCKEREHIKAPDLSNLIKALEDALNKIVYDDDRQIVQITSRKSYGEQERITVEIEDV